MAVDELEAIDGSLEGSTFRRAGSPLGVAPFGMSIIGMPADTTANSHQYKLDAEHVIRVGPTARREILPGS